MPTQNQEPRNERPPLKEAQKSAAPPDETEFFDASFTGNSMGPREAGILNSGLASEPGRAKEELRQPAKEDSLPPAADRALKKFCDGMDAGVWFARASMGGLVTVAAGAGAYSLLMGGSYLLASACTVAAVAAGWSSARMAAFAWLAVRGKGNGII